MSEIQTSNFSETAASNSASPPDGFPEGQTAASLNNSARELMAAIKREWNRSHYTVDAGGTSDAMTLTYTTAPPALVQGMVFTFKSPTGTNTGEPTIDVNGLGAVPLLNAGGVGLFPGHLPTDTLVSVIYDGSDFRMAAPLVTDDASTATSKLYYPNGAAEEMGYSATVNGIKTVSFTTGFSTIRSVQLTPGGGSGASTLAPLFTSTPSATGMVVYGAPTESFGFFWRVLGQI